MAVKLTSNKSAHSLSSKSQASGSVARTAPDDRSDRNSEPSTSQPAHPIALRRIGITACAVLVAALCSLIIVSSFLAFLWYGTDDHHDWRSFIEDGQVTRAITLSSAVIRVAISTTAGICTAMLAAIILENHEVLIRDAASTSAMQFVHSPPATMLPTAIRALGWSRLTVIFPLILLVGTTVLSQLCSTALVSDLQTLQIPGSPQRANVPYTFSAGKDTPLYSDYSPANLYRSANSLGTPLTSFIRFAESSQPDSAETADYLHDTGPSIRAYLPLASSQDREAVKDYTGRLFAADHQVKCYRPVLSDVLISQAHTTFRGYEDNSVLILNATIKPTDQANLNMEPRSMSCVVAGSVNPSIPGRQASLCALPTVRTINGTNITTSSTYVVIDSNGGVSDFYANSVPQRNPSLWSLGSNSSTYQGSAEWLIITTISGLQISLSYCVAAFNTANVSATASSEAYASEEVYPFADTSLKGLMMPPSVDRLLGPNAASRFSLEERGLLKLNAGAWSTALGRVWLGLSSDVTDSSQTGSVSIMACAACGCPVYNDYQPNLTTSCVAPSKDHVLLFQHGLMGGEGRPAYAVQALLGSIMAQNYYAQLSYFDQSINAQATFFIQALAPGYTGGFSAVMTVIVLHVFTCIVVTAAFFNLTTASYLSESWYTTAQLIQPGTARILAEGSKLKWQVVPMWSKDLKKTQKSVFRTGSPGRDADAKVSDAKEELGQSPGRRSLERLLQGQ